MQDKPLWEPSPSQLQTANLTHFMAFVNDRYPTSLTTFKELHEWSISHNLDFWRSVWDFCGVIASDTGKREILSPHGLFKTQYFPDAHFNYAENLLRPRPSDMPMLIFWGEDKVKRTLTFEEVYSQVARLAAYLKLLGVEKGDRVAGYVPNMPEAVIAMLATTSLGALWSSCSPDFGVKGVLDRFGQITPKVLLMTEGYYYNNKRFDCLEKGFELSKNLPSLEKIIVFPYGDKPLFPPSHPAFIRWEDALKPFDSIETIDFVQVPFNHPAFILYSSGTTGIPKPDYQRFSVKTRSLFGIGGVLRET